MPAREHLFVLAAAEDVGDVGGAEALADPRDAREDLARKVHRAGHRLQLTEAVVARAAIVALYVSPK